MRFTITITHYHWACGDGCCSDSGYKLRVYDNKLDKCVLDDDDWECHYDEEARLSEGVAAVMEVLGRIPIRGEDYELESEYEDSEQE